MSHSQGRNTLQQGRNPHRSGQAMNHSDLLVSLKLSVQRALAVATRSEFDARKPDRANGTTCALAIRADASFDALGRRKQPLILESATEALRWEIRAREQCYGS